MDEPTPPACMLFVAATRTEAEMFAGRHAAVRVVGVGRAGLARLHELLRADRPEALVGVGVAGALDRSLAPGDVALVEHTRLAAGGKSFTADAALLRVLAVRCRGAALAVRSGGALTVDGPLHDPELRDYYARHSGCRVVDMESARWAAAAAGAGVPFAAVRVVSDRAELALPDLRHRLLRPSGTVRWARWARALARSGRWRRPVGEFAALRQARADWQQARAAMRRVGEALLAAC